MKTYLVKALIAIITIQLLTGCATIVSGSKQDIKIISSPESAGLKIYRVTGAQTIPFREGNTPSTFSFQRGHSYLVIISKEGFEHAEIPIDYGSMNGWIWGNIIIGGIPGMIIDTLTGAMYNLGPEEIDVSLEPLPLAQTEK